MRQAYESHCEQEALLLSKQEAALEAALLEAEQRDAETKLRQDRLVHC